MTHFTDIHVFDDEDADSIVSVPEVLETMDEDGVAVSEGEFLEMRASLNSNAEYAPLQSYQNKKPAAKAVGFLARPARFERAAFRLGGERSILLSYGRIFHFRVAAPVAGKVLGCLRWCILYPGELRGRLHCPYILQKKTAAVK